jgi:hypothetical protein
MAIAYLCETHNALLGELFVQERLQRQVLFAARGHQLNLLEVQETMDQGLLKKLLACQKSFNDTLDVFDDFESRMAMIREKIGHFKHSVNSLTVIALDGMGRPGVTVSGGGSKLESYDVRSFHHISLNLMTMTRRTGLPALWKQMSSVMAPKTR